MSISEEGKLDQDKRTKLEFRNIGNNMQAKGNENQI